MPCGRTDSQIDKKLVTHDVILRDVYEKLRPLLNPPPVTRKELGFHAMIGRKKAQKAQKKKTTRGVTSREKPETRGPWH